MNEEYYEELTKIYYKLKGLTDIYADNDLISQPEQDDLHRLIRDIKAIIIVGFINDGN